jgi:hypothetical protein
MAEFFNPDGADEDVQSRAADECAAGVAADLLRPCEETRHEIHFGEATEYAHCIDGAPIAAELLEVTPVTVRSQDPVSGGAVVFEVSKEGVAVYSNDVVVSMGIAEAAAADVDVVSPGVAMARGDVRPETYVDDPLDRFCRNFDAFEDVATYEEWVTEGEAVSLAVPATVFAGMIRDLVESPALD